MIIHQKINILYLTTKILFVFFALIAPKEIFAIESIETKHFKILFEKDGEKLAYYISSFADDVYDKLSDYFGYTLSEKLIKVSLWTKTDTYNGMLYPFPKSIRIMPSEFSARGISGDVEQSFRTTFLHEVVHYFAETEEDGFFGVFAKILGPSVSYTQSAFISSSFIEGIATYLETILTESGRGEDPEFLMGIRAYLVYNQVPSEMQIRYNGTVPFYNGRYYAMGYLLIKHIIEKYGKDVFLKIKKEYKKFPLIGEEYYILKVLGKREKEIWQELIYENKMALEKEGIVDNSEAFHKTNKVYENREIFGVYNGKVIIQKSYIEGPGDVGYYDGDKFIKLFKNDLYYTSSSKNLKYVGTLPVSKNKISYYDIEKSELFYSDERGRRKKIDDSAFFPSISPDGNHVLAVKKEDYFTTYLAYIDHKNAKSYPIFRKEGTYIYDSAISPSNSKVAFVERGLGIANDIIICNVVIGPDGKWSLTEEKRITSTPGMEERLSFLDDNRLFFVSETNDKVLKLFEYNLKEDKFYKIQEDKVGVASIAFLKDDRIYYASLSPNGIVTKSVPFKEEPFDSANFRKPSVDHPNLIIEKTANIKKYYDFAFPTVWYPYINILDMFNYGFQYPFENAIEFHGWSYFSSNQSYKVHIGNYYSPAQINAEFDYHFNFNILQGRYNFSQKYYPGLHSQSVQMTSNSFSLGLFPVFENGKYGTSYISVIDSFKYSYFLYSDYNFNTSVQSQKIADKYGIYSTHLINNLASVYYSYYLPVFDHYMNFYSSFSLLFKEDFEFIMENLTKRYFKFTSQFKINIPIYLLGLESNLYYVYSNSKSRPITPFTRNGRRRQNSNTFAINAILKTPIANVDSSILNFGIKSIGAKLFMETSFGLDDEEHFSAYWDEGFWTGFIIDLNMALNYLPFRIGLGLDAYIDSSGHRERNRFQFIFNFTAGS